MMLAVLSAKIVEIDGMELHIAHCENRGFMAAGAAEFVDLKYTQELIRGRRFRTYDGREYLIGMSRAVQDALLVPLQAIDDIQAWNHRLSSQLADTAKLLREARRELSKYQQPLYVRAWESFKGYLRLL